MPGRQVPLRGALDRVVILSGNPDLQHVSTPCLLQVLTAYARECERAKIDIHNWRQETGCLNVTSFTFGNGGGGHGGNRGRNDLVTTHYNANEVANVAVAANSDDSPREHEAAKWAGQVLSAATLNDQQKVDPVTHATEGALGRVEAGELNLGGL